MAVASLDNRFYPLTLDDAKNIWKTNYGVISKV